MRSQVPTRPPRDKRYGWFRKYRGYPYDPKWRTISRWTRVRPAVVIAIVDCILDAAAGGKPRGSIAEFSHEECRSALELRTTGPVKKVVKALEKMGWIDREYLTKWDELQPDEEDQTAAERQQRRRAKIRQQNQAEFPPSRVTGFPPAALISTRGIGRLAMEGSDPTSTVAMSWIYQRDIDRTTCVRHNR